MTKSGDVRQLRLETALGRKLLRTPVQALDPGDEICDIDRFPPSQFTGHVQSTQLIGRGEHVRITLTTGYRFERPRDYTVLVGPGLVAYYQ